MILSKSVSRSVVSLRTVPMACATALLLLLITTDSVANYTLFETLSMKEQIRQQPDPDPSHQRHTFVPNDPLFPQQWHLSPTGSRPHVNIQGAWNRGLTGAGVTIGIIDDGLQRTHPDLAPLYNSAASFDFGQNDSDPSPFYTDDEHGTSVAGVAAARGGNGVGVTGAAPGAQLAGLRADFQNPVAGQFASATRYLSDGPGSLIDIKNHSYGVPFPYVNNSAEVAAAADSAAWGTIHVVSAGNGRGGFGDSNKEAFSATPNTISVAALAFDGEFADYSSFGANIFVTAPSSGGGIGITTTDRTGSNGYSSGDYTSTFGGTSSAAPLVAGVLALAKEANPAMDSRMAKHLLALTSDNTIDANDATEESDGGWKANAAGYQFNQNYGFGLIDADALTLAAPLYSGVTAAESESTGYQPVNRSLPDAIVNDQVPSSLTETFTISEDAPLEEMLITFDVDHTYSGDLSATLVSPQGTATRLMQRNIGDGGDDLNWAFTANAFWGENAAGEWSLTLEDWFSQDTGTWRGFEATALTGSLIAVPEPAAVILAVMGLMAAPRRR